MTTCRKLWQTCPMDFNLGRALEATGKALAPHPAFMDRSTPTAIYAPGSSGREDAVLSQRESIRHSDAYGGGQAIDWVYDCIGLYADAASTAHYHLQKRDGTKLVRVKTAGVPPEYEVGPAALYSLLDKPNPFMLYEELMALLVIDLLLVGNAYWFKWRSTDGGRPLALYRLAPSHVKIKPSRYGPKEYEYQPPGVREKMRIKPENIIHFRRPNPHSSYYGMGVIQGAGRSMDLELAITDTMASYYENKADPSLIIQSERRVPRDVFRKLYAQLRSRVAGAPKSGELLVLEAGLKASTLSPNASQAMFEALARMSRDRIFAKFRASPRLFGIMDETGGTDKVSDLRREFDNSTLRPFLRRLSGQISAGLAEAWDVQYVIEHRSAMPPEELVKVAGEIAKVPGIKVREVRRQYEQFGIPESTGDEEIDNFVLNMPTPEIEEDGQITDPATGQKVPNRGADRPLPREPGRPPLGENTRGFGSTAGKSLEAALAALEAKAMNSAGENVSVGNRLEGEKRPDDTFAFSRNADINAAAAFIESGLADAARELERSLLDHVEGKALKTTDLVSRVRRSEAWKTFSEQVSSVLREGIRRAASSAVMQSGLTPSEEIDYDEIADDVIGRPEGVRSIVKTLRDRVTKRIRDARDAHAEREDFDAEVREVINEWMTGSATTVAETEAVHGYNEATLSVAEASGVTRVFVTDGDDHDEPCKDANGQVWDIATARERRLEHPRCRRAFLPLTAEAVG